MNNPLKLKTTGDLQNISTLLVSPLLEMKSLQFQLEVTSQLALMGGFGHSGT